MVLAAVACASFPASQAAAQDNAGSMGIISSPYAGEGLTVSCGPGSEVIGVLNVYSQTCTATGGSGIYSWLVSGLPSSFSKSDDNGATMTIHGIPYHRATDTLIVTAMDASSPSLTGTTALTVVAQPGLTGATR